MQAINIFSSIPPDAVKVQYCFGKAGNQDLWTLTRVAAVGMAIICSIGNVFIYSVDWALKKVVFYIFWASNHKEDLVDRNATVVFSNLCKSVFFVAKAVSTLACIGLGGFSIPVESIEIAPVQEGWSEGRDFFEWLTVRGMIDEKLNEGIRSRFFYENVFLVNDKNIETIEELEADLQTFLKSDDIKTVFVLYDKYIHEYVDRLIDKKLCIFFGSDSNIREEKFESSDKTCIIAEKDHIKMENFVKYHAYQSFDYGNIRIKLPFTITCSTTIVMDFQTIINSRVHYTLSCNVE